MKYYIVTYGCQMNLHESEKLAGIFEELGYTPAASEREADAVLFNTCCIRENAENHAFGNIGALKKLKKQKRDMLIIVCGCMAQEEGRAKELLEKFPFVDIVFGTHNAGALKELIERRRKGKRLMEILPARERVEDGLTPVRKSYPNAWVNISYGCNNFCSYCIVPYVRGRECSRKGEIVLREVESLLEEGYREITLLGQNVNSYNNDGGGGMSFASLLKKAASFGGKYRLRFMTSHPKDFSEELAAAMVECDNVMKTLHLPVQAGSNRILKLMNRRYTREDYLKKLEIFRKYNPKSAVTTDLIVGFPTETEEEFEETLSLVKEADFASAFTFAYSPREGTAAAKMEGQIPDETKSERLTRLIALVNEKTREKSALSVGERVEILCEAFDEKRGLYLGRDSLGRMGYFASEKNLVGNFITLQVERASGISLFGTIQKE